MIDRYELSRKQAEVREQVRALEEEFLRAAVGHTFLIVKDGFHNYGVFSGSDSYTQPVVYVHVFERAGELYIKAIELEAISYTVTDADEVCKTEVVYKYGKVEVLKANGKGNARVLIDKGEDLDDVVPNIQYIIDNIEQYGGLGYNCEFVVRTNDAATNIEAIKRYMVGWKGAE